MNADQITYALAKQICRANALDTSYGTLELDEEMADAVRDALRPILERRRRAIALTEAGGGLSASMSIGEFVETLQLYGFSRTLTAEEREQVIDFARQFEECDWSREELAAQADVDLVHSAYSAMADYARGLS